MTGTDDEVVHIGGGWWHRSRCSASSPPAPHLSSARNLLPALTCHNCHTGHIASPGASPAHSLLLNALRSPPGLLSALPSPGAPLSAAELQDPPPSKITLAQGFQEKDRRLLPERLTPPFPFCRGSLHLPSSLGKL